MTLSNLCNRRLHSLCVSVYVCHNEIDRVQHMSETDSWQAKKLSLWLLLRISIPTALKCSALTISNIRRACRLLSNIIIVPLKKIVANEFCHNECFTKIHELKIRFDIAVHWYFSLSLLANSVSSSMSTGSGQTDRQTEYCISSIMHMCNET